MVIKNSTPGMLAQTVNSTPGVLAPTVRYTAPVTTTVNSTPASHANASLVNQNQQLGTVEGRTASILQADSPLMQRARARANEADNARGLRNSSMAVGAAQNAVIDAAAPIANSDAASFNQFQLSNQNAQNSMEQFNVGNEQQTNLTNANAENRTNMFNAQSDQQAKQFNAQQSNTMTAEQERLNQQNSQFNAQQKNKVVFNQLDQNNKIELKNIEATYKNEMQANVTASNLFANTMGAISKIQFSTKMNSATKQQNIDQMVYMLKTGMNVAGSISNLNLGGLLDFSGLPAVA